MNNANTGDEFQSKTKSPTYTRPTMVRAMTVPNSPTSPLADNPWYQQKFELYRDAIEEKLRQEYPDLPEAHQIKPNNIERSAMQGYDLDFPVDLHDGKSTIVSIAYGRGTRPPYTKEERAKLVFVRQNTMPS